MNAFEKVVRFITEKMAWVSMVAVVGCVALVMADVIRYTLIHEPIPGTHELVELIASVILSTSIAYVTFVKGHVSVDILVDRFRPRTQAFYDLVNSIISLAFTAWLTVGMFSMAMRNHRLRLGDGGSANSQGAFYVLDWRIAGTDMPGPCHVRDQGRD